MLSKSFPLDKKSISRLASRGLSLEVLKAQIDESIDMFLEISRAQGVNIIRKHGYYFFDTKYVKLPDATFCIVDIETNGSHIDRHQIIEIAALKIKNGKVIDSFDTLIKTEEINPIISELTGIKAEDTCNAPELQTVMEDFKLFLSNTIFVAHDVKFDYSFISDSMVKVGLEPLLNRPLCTLAFAERSVISYRYGLSYLNDTFHLNPNPSHHRAMSDVVTTFGLFLLSLDSCTERLNNVEDLIKFSRIAPRLKRPKFDPFLEDMVQEEEQ